MADIVIYSKQWCPYCNKAKALLRAKAMQYREIDITHDEAREQEMIERTRRRSVPQIFIDDEAIGGYDDLAQLNAEGTLDRLLGISEDVKPFKLFDVVIVGAGPAGMAAALYCSRKNLSTAVISLDIGGQMGTTYQIENYPGVTSVTGPDLVHQFEQQGESHAIHKFIGERVQGIQVRNRCKILSTASGKAFHGRTVILASGAFKRKLDIPGEAEFAGKGVVYCSTCDGPLFKNKRVAIVGGGNSALEAAIEMAGIASKVYLIARGEWSGETILQDKVATLGIETLRGYRPVRIAGNASVECLEVESQNDGGSKQLDVEGVFVEIGLSPNSDYALDLLETNGLGEIRVNRSMETGMRGVFAAGDVTDGPEKQVVIAAGEGARAALAVFDYLVHQA
ncbi:MAG: glutaredoxin 3 [Gammaproteobacteria bacterium]|nr:glutaredoxin 3 [Gammaproteobacteria bacterium]